MAGYPSYPRPAGPPFGIDPRQQRRLLKDHARAQRSALRAQRELYRQQTRAMRRGSVLGPLILVALGVVLLLIRMGRIPFFRFATWYSHWWPLLFVAAGIVLLLEWAIDQHRDESGSTVPYTRRSLGGGVILLLILLALSGAVIQGAANGHDVLVRNINVYSDNLPEFFGEKHTVDQQIDEPLAPGTTLTIDNPRGDVTILGKSLDDRMHITVSKQVWSLFDTDSDAKANELNPRISRENSNLSISMPAVEGGSTDLDITVPDRALVTIHSNRGDVHISSLHAPVSVIANRGEVELNSIVGTVTAQINHSGSSFSAHAISGDVFVKGNADDLTLSDVHGQVSLQGDFYGDTHLEHLYGPVTFQTSRTSLKLAQLPGEVEISSDSEMTGSELVGPTTLHTRSRNVSFERIAGSLDLTNSNGTVDVTSAAPLGNVTIVNSNGEVKLTVPEQAGFVVEAATKGGSIDSNLGLSAVTVGDQAMLHGTKGNGAAKISLNTSHADISFHEGVVAPAPPATPPPVTTQPSAESPKRRVTKRSSNKLATLASSLF